MAKKEIAAKVNAALAKSKKPGTLAGLNSESVMDVLSGMKEQISMALPKHLTADRMLSIATTVISQNPKLAECSATSLIGAVMQASILGFKPTPVLGEVYFVPFSGKVQVIIGYKGYISLARRSGEIKTLYAYPVYENDEFTYELGLNPKLDHKPAEGNRGNMTHVYAVAHYKDEGYNFMVLSREEVEKLRKRNPMQKGTPSGAWSTDYQAMACAKAIKQLSKYMPLSDEMQTAVTTDEKIIEMDSFTNNQEGIDINKAIDPEFQDVEEVIDEETELQAEFNKAIDEEQKGGE